MGFLEWLFSEGLDPNHPALMANRMEILDRASAGGYEMYLMRTDHTAFPEDMRLQVAVQRSDMDLMDPAHQLGKAPVRNLVSGLSAVGGLGEVLKSWIGKYGPVSVSSLDDSKTGKWAAGLRWMGFDVRRRVFDMPGGMGEKEYFIISS